ncbi:hypothetical protein [Bradyrhizobium neotropicale]|uniref:hypothetical protein n=1 Tax=Bradyrhizobium neotropicale TaxID=1497615 RepID=UPI001AD616A1|nr:hypothetical protein [Bradyrhizobium neotropicale]MBO4220850.1 hypothetical protein [Bradyrhizobium neotropicale]
MPVQIVEAQAPQLSARLNASRARIKALKLRLQLEKVPLELVVNEDNGDEAAWRLKACPSLMFVNGAGELDQKHHQDLRDTCVMLLDRAGCDLLTICDITGRSYRRAQTIAKHYRARNVDRADAGIDRLELQVRKEGMKG